MSKVTIDIKDLDVDNMAKSVLEQLRKENTNLKNENRKIKLARDEAAEMREDFRKLKDLLQDAVELMQTIGVSLPY